MKYQSKLGERGQVVIPKPIRDHFKLDKNSEIEFEQRGNLITMKPVRSSSLEEFELALNRYAGSLRKNFLAKRYKSVDDYLDGTRGVDETRRK